MNTSPTPQLVLCLLLQVCNSSTNNIWLRDVEEEKLRRGEELDENGRPLEGSYGALKAGFAALEAAVLPAVTGVLKDIVKESEGGELDCEAVTFIPTSRGFCRRVPLVAS